MREYIFSDERLQALQSGFWKDFFEFVVENDVLDDMSEQLGAKIVFAVMKKNEDGVNRILAVDANRKWYMFMEDLKQKDYEQGRDDTAHFGRKRHD